MATSSGLSGSVWSREGRSHVLSKNAFIALLTFWTAAGIAASAYAAYLSRGWQLTIWGILGLFAVAVLGIIIALWRDEPALSLIGYAMVVVPFGLMAGPLVALYTAASVAKVFAITTAVVVVLGIVGAAWPRSLESWGSYLFGGLLILIFGTVGIWIAGACGLPVGGALTWMDWIGVVLFSGYVIYDLNRAMRVERTHDNAIDCAVAVYLDFANLFLRLLSLLGNQKVERD